MADFAYIILIILEIVLTSIAVVKILELEKRVLNLNNALNYYANLVLEINKQIKSTISKINKFVSIVTSKKFTMIKKTLQISMNIVQIIVFIRSLNLSRNIKKINFKTLKKLAIALSVKQLIKEILCFCI